MSNKITDKPTTTTTPTNWFVNVAGVLQQYTAAAFSSLVGALIGTQTHAATSKTTPVDTDELPLSDSAAANSTKKVTWANVWAEINTRAAAVYAALSHTHSAADITSGTLPDARFPSTLPALNGSNLTNLNAAALTSGTIDPARIPLLYSGIQVVSSGAIADLTSPQQTSISAGAIVTTTDGRRWAYSGSGSKTSEASYITLADVTPDWGVISGKPTTFAPPAPTTTVMGGVKRNTGTTGQFVKGVDTDGSLIFGTPAGGSSGSNMAAGSGTLYGYSDPGAPATSPASLDILFNYVPSGEDWGLVIDGTTYYFAWASIDPANGYIWIDTSPLGTTIDAVGAFSTAVLGLSIPTISTSSGMTSSDLLITNGGTGSLTSISISIPGGSATASGGGTGADAIAPSGALTEVTLLAIDGTKNTRMLRAAVFDSATGLSTPVQIALKVGGIYYPIGLDFASNSVQGDVVVSNYYYEWAFGRGTASVVARMTGSTPVGGQLFAWVQAERV